MTRRARAVAAVLLGLAALALVPAAPAQPQPERSPFLVGTHAFRRILYDVAKRKLTPLSPRDVGENTDPTHTLIVVLGNPAPLAELDNRLYGRRPRFRLTETGLNSFVSRGGAFLIATDLETPGLALSFGWAVTGGRLKVPAGTAVPYRGMAECPFIDPVPGREPALFKPSLPAMRGQDPPKVASNLTSYLWAPPARNTVALPVLARLPLECTDDRGRSGPWDFAAGGDFGAGRVLIMADHSVFINEMMLQTDNGNIDFAYRCADWLLATPAGRGKRDKILYYEDGAVQTDFDIPLKDLPPPPLPPPDTLLGMLDETVHAMEEEGTFARMEEEDFFNGTVEDLMRSAPFWNRTEPEWKLWTLLVVAASVALGLYAFVRLGTFRHRPDTTGPALAVLLERQAPAGAVIEQRQEALLRYGNVWEAAREVARHLFAAAGASPDAAPRPPALEVRGPWWRRWLVRRRWGRLWRLARSGRPVRVSPRGFTRLAAQAEALRAALADGTVRVSV